MEMYMGDSLNDETPQNHHAREKWTTIFLVTVFVAYPLSVGPATWVLHHWVDAHSPLWTGYIYFYAPLVFVASLNETLGSLLTHYLNSWVPELIGLIRR